MFDKDFSIKGKHADYWKDLCVLAGNVKDKDSHNNFKIFNAYIDAFILCPLIGFKDGNMSVEDDAGSNNTAGMLAEVIIKRSKEIKFVYQIIMLLDEKSEPDIDKRVYRTFCFNETTEEDRKLLADNMRIYKGYFLRGLEILHERFKNCINDDDYINGLYKYVDEFYKEQHPDELNATINQYLGK